MEISFLNLKVQPGKTITPLIITILVIVGTFPNNDWSFSIGIDPPLKWVFNWLFETGLRRGKNIVFPHGPLAFLMYPLSENILLATVVHVLLKTILVFGITGLLTKSKSPAKWLFVGVFAYVIAIFSGFNHLLLANVILLYINYYEHRKSYFKFAAFLLTALAFFVKAYIAILTGTIFISLLIYELVKHHDIRKTIIDGMCMLGLMLLFQIALYGTPEGFFHYLWGMLHLAQDNSAAAALYPFNNWILLGLTFFSLNLIFVVNRSLKTLFFVSIFTLSLFAAWKHGMAREDYYHVKGLLLYLWIFLSIFLLFERKRWPVSFGIAVIIVVLFGLNVKNSKNYMKADYQFWQGNYFVEFVSNFNELKQQAHHKTGENLFSNRLSQAMLDSISASSADVYPWDYSVAAINNLNWQPRVVIQSYAAYTSWLDKQNAKHWASDSAPEFIVWDKEKITVDVNHGDFNSIDNRYLLNDEPQSLLQILSNYQPCCTDDKFLLLKKRKLPQEYRLKILENTNHTWDQWIRVPTDSLGLVRCKLRFKKTLKQQFKSFLYKDEQIWIYLKLNNGAIHKYRIVPKNAADGIWINPYLFDFERRYRVEQILFKTSNLQIMNPDLNVEWEQITFGDFPDFFTKYFNIENTRDTLIFESINTFENVEAEYWSKLKDEQLTSESFSGTRANVLVNNKYSSTFKLQTDSVEFEKITISADAWIQVPNYRPSSNIQMVIDVENESGKNVYQSMKVEEQIIEEKGWNHVFNSIRIDHVKPQSKLVIYLWSPEKKTVYIDNFRVRISKEVDQ